MVVHSDIWGPTKVPTFSWLRYFVTFIEECTRMTWIALLKKKGDVCVIFQEFHGLVATHYKKNIQVLQYDNGGKFVNHILFMRFHMDSWYSSSDIMFIYLTTTWIGWAQEHVVVGSGSWLSISHEHILVLLGWGCEICCLSYQLNTV